MRRNSLVVGLALTAVVTGCTPHPSPATPLRPTYVPTATATQALKPYESLVDDAKAAVDTIDGPLSWDVHNPPSATLGPDGRCILTGLMTEGFANATSKPDERSHVATALDPVAQRHGFPPLVAREATAGTIAILTLTSSLPDGTVFRADAEDRSVALSVSVPRPVDECPRF